MVNPTPAAAVAPAPRAPASGRLRAKRRPWWIVALVVALAVAVGAFALTKRTAAPAPRYLSAVVTRGDVMESVRATGTVRPVLEVQVGAQISGRVTRVAVDFNSRVRQGDLLAELDATPYRAQLAQARASLASARAVLVQRRADLTLAERNLARANALRAQSLNAQADVDAVLASRDSSRAAVGVAQAQVEQATAAVEVAHTNLTYTRILAPIDGIVATRAVDPGQTVAASLQTPTLFVIDNDLTQMRVIANVDEANIGKLSEGMEAIARVDAFPRESFRGTVRELRITPTTTNGVVTYQAVIDVANPQSRLRPGMTATITTVAARHVGVLRVPNASLRYRPATAATPPTGGAPRAMAAPSGGPPPGAAAPREGAAGGAPPGREGASLYVLRNGQATRVAVTVGLTDGVNTEVSAPELTEGAQVVVDETDSATSGDASRGPRPPRMF